MTSPGGTAVTVLDPGRRRPDQVAVTELDPGRARPQQGGPVLGEGLPPGLDARFVVQRVLHRPGAEADLFLVRERATDAQRVLKLYGDAGPDPNIGRFLLDKRGPHSVRVFEVGTEDGRGYEVMEYLAGGTLAELRESNLDGLDPQTLTDLVGQLAGALVELHDAGFVHRDVNPANILVRMLAPFEVALADFGISVYAPMPVTLADRSGTVRYLPPEFIAVRQLSPALDWWSLGVTVLELAVGQPFLEGLDDDEIRVYVTEGPVAVNVVDDRIRLLCQGLLAQSRRERWGAEQVDRWLAGESPPVPTPYGVRTGDVAAEVDEAFVYLDEPYRNRALLAAAMTTTWQTATALLFGDDPQPLRRLENWLRQYPEPATPWRDTPGDPPDVRLLRLLRWMAPAHPPIYRQLNVAVSTLADIARQAIAGAGNLPEIVHELWRYRLLGPLSGGGATPDLDSGAGLDTVARRWREERRRWEEAVALVDEPGARRRLVGHTPAASREATDRALAICLYAAVATDDATAAVRRDLRTLERAARFPWFTRLVGHPDGMWVAYRLREYVEELVRDRDEQERAAAEHRAWLSRTEAFREWSRRQNRPVALSWAVAGVFILGVVLALLISVSDILGAVSDAMIVDAWVATVFGLLAVLGVESVLAWEIGGRFHPNYSVLGRSFIVLGRAARSISGRGVALIVIIAVLAAAYVLTAYEPVVTPLVAGGGVVIWAVVRYLAWLDFRAREQAETERGTRERFGSAA